MKNKMIVIYRPTNVSLYNNKMIIHAYLNALILYINYI